MKAIAYECDGVIRVVCHPRDATDNGLTMDEKFIVSQAAEIERLRGLVDEAADTIDYAARQAMHLDTKGDKDSTFDGYFDTMAISANCDLGDWLVEAGLWERHPDGHGRRQFYRPKDGTDTRTEPHEPSG